MIRSRRTLLTLAALAAGALPAAATAQSISITGAGATFPQPIYQKWVIEYHTLHPNIQINYQGIGSGGGIRQFTDRTVDFGASDGPMNDSQIAAVHGNVIHIPTVLGAVVPTYNVPGVAQLRFTGEVLAAIYLGQITKWNDSRIAALNPGVRLPDDDIIPVHRSDGSGTNYIFTDYLSKVSPDFQQHVGKGTSVNWPGGLGGQGNPGVASTVSRTPGAIGYVELIYALQNHIAYGVVQNAAGRWVPASLASTRAAAAGAHFTANTDFRVSVTNAPGADAWPICSFTWLLLPRQMDVEPAKASALLEFAWWATHEGQQYGEALSYARLPAPVVRLEEAALKRITNRGRAVLPANYGAAAATRSGRH